MSNGLSSARYQEVEEELNHMESFLVELAQELRDNTAPGSRFSHTWLQVDSTLSYTRSLRAALQGDSAGRLPTPTMVNS
jgi:hypothetical protein